MKIITATEAYRTSQTADTSEDSKVLESIFDQIQEAASLGYYRLTVPTRLVMNDEIIHTLNLHGYKVFVSNKGTAIHIVSWEK